MHRSTKTEQRAHTLGLCPISHLELGGLAFCANSLSLGFFICKLGLIMVSTSQGNCEGEIRMQPQHRAAAGAQRASVRAALQRRRKRLHFHGLGAEFHLLSQDESAVYCESRFGRNVLWPLRK